MAGSAEGCGVMSLGSWQVGLLFCSSLHYAVLFFITVSWLAAFASPVYLPACLPRVSAQPLIHVSIGTLCVAMFPLTRETVTQSVGVAVPSVLRFTETETTNSGMEQ